MGSGKLGLAPYRRTGSDIPPHLNRWFHARAPMRSNRHTPAPDRQDHPGMPPMMRRAASLATLAFAPMAAGARTSPPFGAGALPDGHTLQPSTHASKALTRLSRPPLLAPPGRPA